MEIEIALAIIILLILVFLATVDIAFTQLSDVLRRISSESRKPKRLSQRNLENRPRFRFALSATIQILLIIFAVLVAHLIFSFLK